MSDEVTKSIPLTAEDHGKELAKSIVSSFASALKKQAALSGGYLSKPDVDMLIAAYNQQIPKVAKKISKAVNSFSENSIRDMWDPSRTSAFERVLVKQFSALLADDETAAHDHSLIARRSLPGIFMCVRMMAGPELLEVYEQDAFLVMQRVRDDVKENFTWELVYTDKRTVNMVRELLMAIAPYFTELEKRIEWMLPIINSHLSPVEENSPVAEWQMTEAMLINLIAAMYGVIWSLLEDDTSRMHLTKRFGADQLDVLDNLQSSLTS
jgi:hypothetical protein